MYSFTTDSAIRGHHVYKNIWTPQIDEVLSCEVETGNIHDVYAVAVKRTTDLITVGHVPRKISPVCCHFLRRGEISCTVTGDRRHAYDLPQGGLEVPCLLTFKGLEEDIEKAKKWLARAPTKDCVMPVVTSTSQGTIVTPHNSKENKRQVKLETASVPCVSDVGERNEKNPISTEWVSIEVKSGRTFSLSTFDQRILFDGELLSDRHIFFAQSILRKQYPDTKGLHNTLFIDKIADSDSKIDYGLQIFHDRTNHWVVASNIKRTDNNVEIYDSVYTSVNAKTRAQITSIFQPRHDRKPRLKMMKTQKQVGSTDCGLFAIAIATAILSGQDTSVRLNQPRMRPHLASCFEANGLTHFPTEIM